MQVTALYAALLALLLVYLSARVIVRRRAMRIGMGDGDDPLLARWVRAQANLAEYAPLGLLLILILEQGGWSPWLLHILGLLLVAGRWSHAFAFTFVEPRPMARVLGMVLTLTSIALSSLLCLVQAAFAG